MTGASLSWCVEDDLCADRETSATRHGAVVRC